METLSQKNEIIEFYEKASIYEKLTNLSYEKKLSSNKYYFDFISLKDIELSKDTIDINIPKQLQLFLFNEKKGISPRQLIKNKSLSKKEYADLEDCVKQELFESKLKENSKEYIKKKEELEVKYELKIDKNKLLFSPVYIKVNFEEEDTCVLLPIIFLNISEEKENIESHSYKDEAFKLKIDLENTPFEYNDFVINLFMKESFKDIQSSLFYISNSDDIASTEELIEKIYKNIGEHLIDQENELFTLSFPNVKSDPIGLFFNSQDNVETFETFSTLKKSESPLLEKYLLTKTEKNHTYELQNDLYFGTYSNEFCLGKGQAIVLEKNQKNEDMISVFGAPGTGKTTLFMSIIANNITKRALSLAEENKDFNNLMLVTSTSNKALENIYTVLKKKFPEGFCYIGGNYENKKSSATEIYQLIENLKRIEYKKGSFEECKEELLKIKKHFIEEEINFSETKKRMKDKFGITDISHMTALKIIPLNKAKYKEDKEWIDSANEIVNTINSSISEEFDLDFYMKFLYSKDFKIIMKRAKQLAEMNIFLDIIGIGKLIYKNMKLENNAFKGDCIDSFITIAENIQGLKNYEKDIKDSLNRIKEYQENEEISKIDKDYLTKIFSYEYFGDYFRKEFHKENYRMFLISKRLLELYAIQKKFSVIDSLEYLASGDFYSIKNPKEFLENMSLIYPVVTSTIAGFKYMFKNLDTNNVYESILSDESGMLKVQDLLMPLSKSKRAIIVGDPKQLPPIVTMHNLFNKYLRKKVNNDRFFFTYSPTEVSAYHRGSGTIEGGYKATGLGIILDEHRRCQKPIAELFMSVGEYQNIKIETPYKKPLGPFNDYTLFFNIINREKKDKHINLKEIEAISDILDMLEKNKNINIKKDVSIVTPYTKQEDKIIEILGNRINHSKDLKKIGTVHKFQGAEFKVMIVSCVVSAEEDSLKFINKDPSIVIVSISRAEELLIVVGDYEKISGNETGNYIGRMAHSLKEKVVSLDDLSFY